MLKPDTIVRVVIIRVVSDDKVCWNVIHRFDFLEKLEYFSFPPTSTSKKWSFLNYIVK